jgi:inorganic pyrophosphatase
MTDQIAHFFQHYKDLEKGKITRIIGWADPEEVAELIRKGMERAEQAQKPALLEHKAKA